jgi:hypothetical protein
MSIPSHSSETALPNLQESALVNETASVSLRTRISPPSLHVTSPTNSSGSNTETPAVPSGALDSDSDSDPDYLPSDQEFQSPDTMPDHRPSDKHREGSSKHHHGSSKSSSKSSSHSSSSTSKSSSQKDDWSTVDSPDERRRIQNRIAQRKFRKFSPRLPLNPSTRGIHEKERP